MNTRVKTAIIDIAKATPETEVCGLIWQNGAAVDLYPCPNTTRDPDGAAEAFRIDPQDYIRATQKGRIIGVYHSHTTTGAANFSPADLKCAKTLGLPFYLYANNGGGWSYYIPENYRVPLRGQEWCWGVADCYEIVRSYYRQELGLYLTDYDRDESFEHSDESAITRYIDAEGFRQLPDDSSPQNGDVLLFRTAGAAYPHHLAVWTGPSQMLHHRKGMLSGFDAIDGAWLRRLAGIYRRV